MQKSLRKMKKENKNVDIDTKQRKYEYDFFMQYKKKQLALIQF